MDDREREQTRREIGEDYDAVVELCWLVHEVPGLDEDELRDQLSEKLGRDVSPLEFMRLAWVAEHHELIMAKSEPRLDGVYEQQVLLERRRKIEW